MPHATKPSTSSHPATTAQQPVFSPTTVTCVGPQSAHPCDACTRLNEQSRFEAKQWWQHNCWMTKGAMPWVLATLPRDRTLKSKGVGAERPRRERKKLSDDEIREAFDELVKLFGKVVAVGEPDLWHEKSDTKDVEQRWCESCFYGFRSKEARNQHVRRKHIHCRRCKDLTPYPTYQVLFKVHRCLLQCRYCTQETTFRCPRDRDQHIEEAHFPCMACREIYNDSTYVTFRNAKALLLHKKKHHGDTFCEFCDRFFHSVSARRLHDLDNHVSCPHCPHQLYRDQKELDEQHRQRFCHFCRQLIVPRLKQHHMEHFHPYECEDCVYNQSKDVKLCAAHESKRPEDPRSWSKFWYDWQSYQKPPAEEPNGSDSKRKQNKKKSDWPDQMPDGLPDLYAILNVSPESRLEDIKKAAKEMRIATHPDRLAHKVGLSLMEVEMISETAKNVGFAADILTNVKSRREYHEEVRKAASTSWLKAFWV